MVLFFIFFCFFYFIFLVIAVLLYRAVLSLSYISKEENREISTLPGVCTYVRCAAFGLFSWMENGALGTCKAPVCTIFFTVCSTPFFFLVSERSGRNRPRREAFLLYYGKPSKHITEREERKERRRSPALFLTLFARESLLVCAGRMLERHCHINVRVFLQVPRPV